jgi:hypothetical protein
VTMLACCGCISWLRPTLLIFGLSHQNSFKWPGNVGGGHGSQQPAAGAMVRIAC